MVQAWHGPPSAPEYPGLHRHSVILALPAVESLSLEHGTQVVSEEAPRVVEYLRAGHSWHALRPVSLEYFPAAQSVQLLLPSDAEYLPFVQSRQKRTPGANAYLPIPHRRHALTPVVLEYVPAAQSRQRPTCPCSQTSTYFPALQGTRTRGRGRLAAIAAIECGVRAGVRPVDAEVLAEEASNSVLEYVPAAQSRQRPTPCSDEYVPALQGTQVAIAVAP
jgi:hypothetical protein